MIDFMRENWLSIVLSGVLGASLYTLGCGFVLTVAALCQPKMAFDGLTRCRGWFMWGKSATPSGGIVTPAAGSTQTACAAS